MKPMLAKKHSKGKISFPCFVQPKLNGIRGLYIKPGVMQSRSYGQEEELVWNPNVIEHILEPLSNVTLPLDGEFYVHGWLLQEINSAIGVKRAAPTPKTSLVGYHIFDIIAPIPMSERVTLLAELRDKLSKPLFVVETIYCHSEEFGDQCYNHFRAQKYEGMMYRDYSAIYGRDYNCSNQENRWSCLLKRKERQDLDAECIGTIPSDADISITEPHIAALQLRWQGKVFSGGGGLTNEQKIRYFYDPPIGKLVHISYESLSRDGIPLQPSTELVYD